MRPRSFMLYATFSFVAIGFCAASPAEASYRVVQWRGTHVCQIYDFGWGGRPIPSDYRVLTGPLPSFGAALRAKDRLWHRGRCSI